MAPQYIYSKITPELLLHAIHRKKDIGNRLDISPPDEFLQVSSFSLHKYKTFRAHKHLPMLRTTSITQESWIVVEGKIKAILYDTDDTIAAEIILEPGDCSITFHGGHNYVSMEDNTLVYEYKTGPYMGQESDKTFI